MSGECVQDETARKLIGRLLRARRLEADGDSIRRVQNEWDGPLRMEIDPVLLPAFTADPARRVVETGIDLFPDC